MYVKTDDGFQGLFEVDDWEEFAAVYEVVPGSVEQVSFDLHREGSLLPTMFPVRDCEDATEALINYYESKSTTV